ncbi:MAG: AAA family ATPase [Clostridia bacterium]
MKYPLNWQNNLSLTLSSTKCIVLTGNIHDCSCCENIDSDVINNGEMFFQTPILEIVSKIINNAETRCGKKYDEFFVYNPMLRTTKRRDIFTRAKTPNGIPPEINLDSIDNNIMNYDALEYIAQGNGCGNITCLALELYDIDRSDNKREIYNRLITLFKRTDLHPDFTVIVLDKDDESFNEAATFVKEAPFAKQIEISKPTDDIVRRFLKSTICRDGKEFSSESVISEIIGLTDGFFGVKYLDLAQFFKKYRKEFENNGGKVDINDRLYFAAAIDEYQNGTRTNRWDKTMRKFNECVEPYFSDDDNVAKIKGQKKIKKDIVIALRKAVQGFGQGADGNNIRGCLVFAGPTGTGKTFSARMMAKAIFNSEDYLIRVDMANFQDETSVNSLLGVGAGYVGHDQPVQFINDIKTKGSAILLFDEFEKAHPKMFDIFLQMLDSGFITDHASGTRTSLKDIFIVMTSNKGAKAKTEEESKNAIESFFCDEVNRPEIFGRIGRNNVLVFERLDKNAFVKIFQQEFVKTEGILRNRYPSIVFDYPSDDVAKFFVDTYWEEQKEDEGAQLGEAQRNAKGKDVSKAKGIADLGGRGLKDKMSEIVYTEISKQLSLYEIEAEKSKNFNRNMPLHVKVEKVGNKLEIKVY